MQELIDGRSVAVLHALFDALVMHPDRYDACCSHFLSQTEGDARKVLAVIRRNLAERYRPERYEATAALFLKQAFVKRGSRQIALWSAAERMRSEKSHPIVQRASSWFKERILKSGACGHAFTDLHAFLSLLHGTFLSRDERRNGWMERSADQCTDAAVRTAFSVISRRVEPSRYEPTVELLCSQQPGLFQERKKYAELIALHVSARIMCSPRERSEVRKMGELIKTAIRRGKYLDRPGTERIEAFLQLLG